MSKPPSPSALPFRPEDYAHSPAHFAVAIGDHTALTRLVSSLPRLGDPERVLSESDSVADERIADEISSVLDRRDVPFRETPLHLAVRLNDAVAAQTLAGAGADISLQNSSGWNPLQEALCRRLTEVSRILVRHHHLAAWSKWRRRLPRLIGALRRMRDFYLEIQFHFESSIVPFIGKIAPSDTYRIWKRDGNLRADTSLAGFDGMKIQRADQSFLFLGDGDYENDVPEGSLLVLNRDDRKIFDAFENAGSPMSEDDVSGFCSQTSVYRPGMDVTRAELVGRTNWRRQEKTETVGEWKAKVYEVQNVVFSFRSRKVSSMSENDSGSGGRREEQILPLELDEEDDFLVAENPADFGFPDDKGRRHSSFVRDHRRTDREWVSVGRKSVDINFAPPPPPPKVTTGRKSVDFNFAPVAAGRKSVDVNSVPERRRASSVTSTSRVMPPSRPPLPTPAKTTTTTKEKEYVKSLRPSVWLTEQFPLKTEEMLPLLDILANKVKAVRRMRELLTTKFPPGSFPVKIAIPVVPTVRVVITFTKFVQLQPTEIFYTPISSPRLLSNGSSSPPEEQAESRFSSWSSSSSSLTSSWLGRSNSGRSGNKQQLCPEALESDPFAIPSGYSWQSIDSKNRKMKKSKSVRRPK